MNTEVHDSYLIITRFLSFIDRSADYDMSTARIIAQNYKKVNKHIIYIQ